MSFITRYWIVLFFFANLCANSALLRFAAYPVLIVTMLLGLLVIIGNISIVWRSNPFFKASLCSGFVFAIIVYQAVFGIYHIHPQTWTYFFSKTIACIALVISVWRNLDFYKKNFLRIFIISVFILCFYGSIRYPGIGRATWGFGNANSLGMMASLSFGILLNYPILKNRAWIIFEVLFLCGVLASGSRSAMGIVVLAYIIKYGLSLKMLTILCVTGLVIAICFPYMGLRSIGITRFVDSAVQLDIASGRELEREATLLMIKESPVEGHGLYAGQSEAAKQISKLGSHCGFLDIIKMMGIPIGGILIVYMTYIIFKIFFRFRGSCRHEMRAYLFIACAVYCASFFEGLIWGLNIVPNTLFFLSVTILQLSTLQHETRRLRIS